MMTRKIFPLKRKQLGNLPEGAYGCRVWRINLSNVFLQPAIRMLMTYVLSGNSD